MGSKVTIQIILIAISGVILFTYIQPTFESMRETQDETQEYREALDNAAAFNQELTRLVNQVDSFPTTQRRDLERYLPEQVDSVAVMRDIETIVANNGMALNGLTAAEEASLPYFVPAQGQPQGEETDDALTATVFTTSVLGTYESFKSLLRDFERNAYPLEVVGITFTPDEESSVYTFTLEIETYAFAPAGTRTDATSARDGASVDDFDLEP